MDPDPTPTAEALLGSELEARLLEVMSTAPRRRWRVAELGRDSSRADLLEVLMALDRLCSRGLLVRLGPGRYRMQG
jgi:hypothetical protein